MTEKKWFLEDKELNEYDYITHTLSIILTSVLFMSGGLYGALIYKYNFTSFIVFLVIFAIGAAIYLCSKTGRDFISGIYKWDKEKSLSVHLGIGWFAALLTILIPLGAYSLSASFTLTNLLGTFDVSAFADVATAVIIANSIFAILASTHLDAIRKRILSLYNSLTISIILAFITLFSIAFGLPHSFIFVFASLSISAMYFLIGIFTYLLKLELKTKVGVAGI